VAQRPRSDNQLMKKSYTLYFERHCSGEQAPALRKKDKLFQWLVTTRNHRGAGDLFGQEGSVLKVFQELEDQGLGIRGLLQRGKDHSSLV